MLKTSLDIRKKTKTILDKEKLYQKVGLLKWEGNGCKVENFSFWEKPSFLEYCLLGHPGIVTVMYDISQYKPLHICSLGISGLLNKVRLLISPRNR